MSTAPDSADIDRTDPAIRMESVADGDDWGVLLADWGTDGTETWANVTQTAKEGAPR